MDSFTIVSVWYNKDKFIFNNFKYPFLHNIQYHATKYNYIVIYFIEDETNISIPINDNVKYINFKNMFSEYVTELINIKQKDDQIDLMKNILIKEYNKIKYKYFLLIDMDCELLDIDMQKIKESDKFIIPFFDRSIKLLKNEIDNYFNSYIENYAFLINKANICSNSIFKNNLILSNEIPNSFVYENYINFVIEYYKQSFNFIFPKEVKDLEFFNPVKIDFERGDSWKDIYKNDYFKQEYVYDKSLKPIYNRDILELYINILKNDIDKIINNINYFKKQKYNFKSKFKWSNSLQSDVNLYGVLVDRITNINDLNKIKKLDFFQEILFFNKNNK